MPRVLTINSGSSSVKFSVYLFPGEQLEISGSLARIGQSAGSFRVHDASGQSLRDESPGIPDHAAAFRLLFEFLERRAKPDAIGHRIVHGGPRYTEPQLVTPELIAVLTELIPLAPNHLPREIDALKSVAGVYPAAKQVACFDTAFHRSMPTVAQMYALPEDVRADGVLLRYGFHGLSYEFLVSELRRLGDAGKRVVAAHLGNGASMAAILDGKSVETTMGLTPTGGLVMSTRSGDMDPEVVLYLLEEKKLALGAVRDLITSRGGLLGVSGISGDMRDLEERAASDPRAAAAIAVFCHQARKSLGALAAALGGVDTVVFAGGIGENSAAVRERICAGLDFLGIRIDAQRNSENAPVISPDDAPVKVRVIKTNEEVTIARHTGRLAWEKT